MSRKLIFGYGGAEKFLRRRSCGKGIFIIRGGKKDGFVKSQESALPVIPVKAG